MNDKLYGLTAKDRADWEHKYFDQIQGYNADQKERLFRNSMFHQKFGQDPNFDEYMKLSPEQRDSLYNKQVFQELPDVDFQNKPDSSIYQLDLSALLEAVEQSEQFKANKELFAKLNRWQGTAARSIEEFDKLATEISPYYAKYKGTSYLPNTKLDTQEGKAGLLELSNTYNAVLNTYGKLSADNWLLTEMMNTASENQSVGEKLFNTVLGFGYDAGSMLLTFAGMAKGLVDYALEGDKGFVDSLVDNEWVDYANDVFQYKTYLPERIDEAKKYGIAENPIIMNMADLENFLSFNNLLNVAANQGFTVSSMLLSSGLTGVSNVLTKGAKGAAMAASKYGFIKNAKTLTSTLEWLQRALKIGNGLVIPALVGTTEGVMEANMAGREFLENAEQSINEAEEKAVQDKLLEVLLDPDKFSNYLTKIGLNVEPVRETIAKGDVSDELYQSIVGGIYGELVKEDSDRRLAAMDKAEENASKVRSVVLAGNSVVNGILNATLKSGLHTKSVQEALHRGKQSLNKLPFFKNFMSKEGRFDIVGDLVVAKNPIVKRVLNVVKEPWGEFLEEGSQNVILDVAAAGGEYNLANYINQKYNGEGLDILNESIWEDAKVALTAGFRSAFSKETLVSGIHGALGSMLGTPTLKRSTGPSKRMAGESLPSYLGRRSVISYRNPVYESIKQQMLDRKLDLEDAEILTNWLLDPNVKARYDGAAGTFNWLAEMERAKANNDEFKFETSRMAKMTNDLLALEKLKGTSFYDSFLEELNKVATVEEGTPAADVFISQFRSDVTTDKSDSLILLELKLNATTMLENIEAIKNESDKLDRMFGNSIDSDTKEALIWGKLSMQEWEKLAPVDEEIIRGYGDRLEKVSGIDSEVLQTIAKYGNVSNMKKEKEKLETAIDNATKTLNNKKLPLGKEEKKVIQSIIDSRKDTLEELNQAIETLEEGKDVLTKKDILNLDAKSREAMLEEANRSRYSKKQRKEIEALKKTLLSKDLDALKRVLKAGRRQRAYDRYMSEYTSILADPNNFNTYILNTRQLAADRNLKLQYEDLNKMTDYKDFVKSVEKIRLNSSRRDVRILHETLKDNEHYKRMLREEDVVEGIMDLLLETEKFKDISDNDAYLVSAFTTYLSREGINIENYNDVMLALTETDEEGTLKVVSYIYDLNERLPDGVKVSMNNIGELLTTYKNALDGFKLNEKQVKEANRPLLEKKVEAVAPKEKVQEEAPRATFMDRLRRNQSHNAAHREDEEVTNDVEPKETKGKEEQRAKRFKVDYPNIESANGANISDATKVYVEAVEKDYIFTDDVKDAALQELLDLALSPLESTLSLTNSIYSRGVALASSDSEVDAEVGQLLKRISTVELPKFETNNNQLVNPYTGLTLANVPKTSVLGRFIENSGGETLIREGKVGRGTNRTPIYFTVIDNPEVFDNKAVEDSMNSNSRKKRDYLDELDVPVFAIVENEGGPITIGNKQYTPIGALPNSEISATAAAIRKYARLNKGKLASKGNTLITSLATIHSPKLERSEESQTQDRNFIDLLIESLSAEDLAVLKEGSSKTMKETIWRRAMNNLLNHFRVGRQDKLDATPLYYVEYKLKGRPDASNWEDSPNYYKFRVFTNSLEEMTIRMGDQQYSLLDFLLNSSPENITTGNNRLTSFASRMDDYAVTLEDRKDWVVTDDGPIKGSELKATWIHNMMRDYVNYPGTVTLRPRKEGNDYVTDAAGDYIVDVYLDEDRLGKISGPLSVEDKAEIIKNLLLKNGSFRKGVIFQVNKNIVPGGKDWKPDNEANFRRVYSELVEDGIIRSGMAYLYRKIDGVELDVPNILKDEIQEDINPNQDNANTGGRSDNLVRGNSGRKVDPDTGADADGNFVENEVTSAMKEALNKVEEMHLNSSRYSLTETEESYAEKDNPLNTFARVTSVIAADEQGERFEQYVLDLDGNVLTDKDGNPIENPWILPSTHIGNDVDSFVRDFFEGILDGLGLEGGDPTSIDNEALERLRNKYASFGVGISLQNLYKGLLNLKANALKGLTVVSKDIKAKGNITVYDDAGNPHDLPVMGTLDLLAYDSNGDYYIIDIKTKHGLISDKDRAKWARQLSLYKTFLEKEYGITIKGIKVLPIKVEYPNPSRSTKYSLREGTLFKNKDAFYEASPRVMREGVISLNPIELNILFDKLSESDKQHLKNATETDLIGKVEDGTPDPQEDTTGRRKIVAKGTPIDVGGKPLGLEITPEQLNGFAEMLGKSLEEAQKEWDSMDEEGKQNTLTCLF